MGFELGGLILCGPVGGLDELTVGVGFLILTYADVIWLLLILINWLIYQFFWQLILIPIISLRSRVKGA